MRCGAARRRLSDEIDGALRPGRKAGVEAHLRVCPACRAYRDGLGRIQAAAALPAAPSPEFWDSFEERVSRKIAAGEAGRASVAIPFASRRRSAWAAAAAAVLAGVALGYVLLRPGPPATGAWVPYADPLDGLIFAAESDPELAGRVEQEIRVSIDELLPAPEETESAVVFAADPFFWEGLSEDELQAIVAALENESGHGGPK
jgi:hypothetical protein